MIIKITNGYMSDREQQAYLKMGVEKYPNNKIRAMEINIDGEYVDVKYIFEAIPFQRIRRITGYLVGTLDRFNNAKRAEVDDRVKHNL
jgi:hypothetical protein